MKESCGGRAKLRRLNCIAGVFIAIRKVRG
jgi:hypothetical protein